MWIGLLLSVIGLALVVILSAISTHLNNIATGIRFMYEEQKKDNNDWKRRCEKDNIL